MPHAPGDRFGPYEIAGRLGEGGMGVVYRARDTRLGRDVALKVLPLALAGDAGRRSRFEREAQALAALNHPHIAAVHDFLETGGQHAIVMELVAGQTLAQRIAGGPLPWRDVVRIGIDISGALAAAHAAGIVHRDLKPANIVITDDGAAKVLDFGIARLADGDAGTGLRATATALTSDGGLIGSAGYMSPEQAQGQPVDARTDIFSLGVVLYETLSGRPAFQGDTTAAIVAAALRDDLSPIGSFVASTPRALERTVMRCLAKDPRHRYQHALDLKAALEDLREDLAAPAPARHGELDQPVQAGRTRWLRPLALTAAALALSAAGYLAGAVGGAPPAPRYRPLITEVTSASLPAWSPDGRTLAYLDVVDGRTQVFVRGIDSARSTALTKETATANAPFWAPDGSKIYFSRASDARLVSVGAGGGEPQLVSRDQVDSDPFVGRGCISPDGATIVLPRGRSGDVKLWALNPSTGDARALDIAAMPRPVVIVHGMSFSPDGRTLAILASNTAANQVRGIWLVSWPDLDARLVAADSPYLFQGPTTIGWMPDSRRLMIAGLPQLGGATRLVMVDTAAGTVGPLTGGKDRETDPAVTSDGRRLAFVSQGSQSDLIQFPIDGGPPETLAATLRQETYPDMVASGLLAYVSDADGSPSVRLRSRGEDWSRTLDAAGRFGGDPIGEVRLSPDGQRAAVGTYGVDHVIWVVPTAGGTPVRIDTKSTDHHGPSWSPDGNWIAYRRLVDGAWSIVKTPVGGGEAVRLDEASAGGGTTAWSPDGQWIAHERPDGMHLVPAAGGTVRVLAGLRSNAFRFSRDAARLFVVRRGDRRQWELAIWDVSAGQEVRVVPLPAAPTVDLQMLAMTPDDSRLIVSAVTNRADIWLLEEFEAQPSWLSGWLRR
jgi:Tol biopolymer transport system component